MVEPPPINPDTIARTAKATADIYGDAVARLLDVVARRMARGIDEPGWAEAKLLDLIGLRADAQSIIDDLAEHGPPAVRKAIEDAFESGRVGAARQLRITMSPWTNTSAVDALARETVGRLRIAEHGILRSIDDVYRQIVAEVSAPGVVTGTETLTQSIQRALNRFADRGITGFIDTAGRNWSIESYAEMATRTATSRAMIEGRLGEYRANGRELVIVSDHPQECELCRKWEGKILAIAGPWRKGDTLEDGAKVAGTLDDARRDGLYHPNCRHDCRPYIVGLTRPYSGTEDPEGDAQRQEQRRLERQVRKWKNREAVAVDDRSAKIAKAQRRVAEERLSGHIRDHDLKRQRHRERTGTSEITWKAPASNPVQRSGVTPSVPPKPKRQPVGPSSSKPVRASDTLGRIPSEHGRAGRAARSGLDAIDRVHRVPPARTAMPSVETSSSKRFAGQYSWRPTTQRPLKIELSTHGTDDGMSGTFAHEFGHYMDHQLLGRSGEFLTLNPDKHMRRVLDAIDTSTEGQRLAAAKAMGKQGADYYTMPEEMWARAYAQWIADRSGDTQMAKALQKRRKNPGVAKFSQWSPDQFGPIADAIDALMRANGLMP